MKMSEIGKNHTFFQYKTILNSAWFFHFTQHNLSNQIASVQNYGLTISLHVRNIKIFELTIDFIPYFTVQSVKYLNEIQWTCILGKKYRHAKNK